MRLLALGHLVLIPGSPTTWLTDLKACNPNLVRVDPVSVSLLKLPPYSPELNPMEQVWQWFRQRYLSNRVFQGYEEIVEQVSRAWDTFIADVERVKNRCWREWINLVN